MTEPNESNLIYVYSRKQAVADGFQVDVSHVAIEAGIRFPVFLTRTVYDACITVPPEVCGQDESDGLLNLLLMLQLGIKMGRNGSNRIQFSVPLQINTRNIHSIELIAICDALDIDDSRPAITVTLPGED